MKRASSNNTLVALFKEEHSEWDEDYMMMTQLLIGENFTKFSFLRATPAMAHIKAKLQKSFTVKSADSQRSILDSESWGQMLQVMRLSIDTFNNDDMQQDAHLNLEHKSLMEYYLSLCLAHREYNNLTQAEITQFRRDQEQKFDERCWK